ncbi:MAG TPA: hypothetical protein VNZ52_04405, partial [Candidatus Thermoplasmatota archaeon]|nr:hypothetical protein [Candidatus Thermoplasmatota archaeon]
LTEPGIYMMHCHPHPENMLHNVTVDASAQEGGEGKKVYVTLGDIYAAPQDTFVKPGTTVVFVNGGVAMHTSTQLGFRGYGGSGASLPIIIPKQGAYNLILTAQDAKGARSEVKIPVLVTDTLPPTEFTKQESGTIQVVNPAQATTQVFPLRLNYATPKLDLALTYDGTVPLNKLSFSLHKGDASGEPLGSDPAAISLTDLVAGVYTIVVTGESGANISFTVDIAGTYTLEPRPEDLAQYAAQPAGGGHNH